MDLIYVDILANDNNAVKCLLVRQDLLGRTVDANGKKTKDSKKSVRAFLTMITKKNRSTRSWVDNGTNFAAEFENYAKLKEDNFSLQ